MGPRTPNVVHTSLTEPFARLDGMTRYGPGSQPFRARTATASRTNAAWPKLRLGRAPARFAPVGTRGTAPCRRCISLVVGAMAHDARRRGDRPPEAQGGSPHYDDHI